ncbi:hypothetical protein [Pectinatus haikarae]|uniref:Uncharacterized protein n=1 Tax=Pectinatus haikarae TaxID=349096 RepID=A0ABT9YA76_9FIRM|nr:hypothetical protein [Pectinatus haikarae]MDQ0204102.1 hypothetical protein [Pectinatus haikarae]
MDSLKDPVPMTTIHEDLQEIIQLLKDIQRNQYVLLADQNSSLLMSTDVGAVSMKIVKNGLEQFGIHLNAQFYPENIESADHNGQSQG